MRHIQTAKNFQVKVIKYKNIYIDAKYPVQPARGIEYLSVYCGV